MGKTRNEFEKMFTPARSYDWSVFRCPPISTLKLERELAEVYGMKVWTPVRWVHRRVPRRRSRVWSLRPIMSSFLFVGVDEMVELLGMKVVGVKPMMDRGLVVALGDGELDELRLMDNRLNTPGEDLSRPKSLRPGDHVEIGHGEAQRQVIENMFGTYEGVVVEVRGSTGEVSVALKNFSMPVWFQGFLLEWIEVDQG